MEESLREYLAFQEGDQLLVNAETSFVWTRGNTLLLIDLYKNYRKNVGTFAIKNFKKLWEVISSDLKMNNVNCTPANCENRWRVLERNFKKYIDNAKKTGRGRKDFEFAEEMGQILGTKKNIVPECVISTNTIVNLKEDNISTPVSENVADDHDYVISTPSTSHDVRVTPQKTVATGLQTSAKKSFFRISKRVDVLDRQRGEKKQYNDARLALEKEKLEAHLKLEKEKLEERKERNKLLKQHHKESIEEKRQRNKLIKEQNELLKKTTELLEKVVNKFDLI
ncbi:uncharacterized protein [Diabrotica undecimpunctata]|uniref:uncharacterized protein n=1 Tax=Diabrotica undecimpunctata TaxID=50387 RepID=UPI003B641054